MSGAQNVLPSCLTLFWGNSETFFILTFEFVYTISISANKTMEVGYVQVEGEVGF